MTSSPSINYDLLDTPLPETDAGMKAEIKRLRFDLVHAEALARENEHFFQVASESRERIAIQLQEALNDLRNSNRYGDGMHQLYRSLAETALERSSEALLKAGRDFEAIHAVIYGSQTSISPSALGDSRAAAAAKLR